MIWLMKKTKQKAHGLALQDSKELILLEDLHLDFYVVTRKYLFFIFITIFIYQRNQHIHIIYIIIHDAKGLFNQG